MLKVLRLAEQCHLVLILPYACCWNSVDLVCKLATPLVLFSRILFIWLFFENSNVVQFILECVCFILVFRCQTCTIIFLELFYVIFVSVYYFSSYKLTLALISIAELKKKTLFYDLATLWCNNVLIFVCLFWHCLISYFQSVIFVLGSFVEDGHGLLHNRFSQHGLCVRVCMCACECVS